MAGKMKVIAMDENRENMVVFQFANENAPDMYVFVKLDEEDPERCCKVENITEFPRYGNWTGEGMYVGNYFPEDKIDKAIELMEGPCKESVKKGVERFRKDIERRKEREGFKHLEDWEKEIMDGIEMVKKDELGANQYSGIGIF